MKSPYQDLPKEAYWRSAVAERHPLTTAGLYRKKFDIDGTQPVATAGSCFAQHIARHMKQRGFDVLDKEPAPRGMTQEDGFRFGYGMYSARYANIYVAQQLLQLAREALGESKPTREQLVWEDDQGRYYDAMRPSVEPEGLGSPEEVLAHRADHLSAVRAVLEEAKVFVFTFGLTESWVLRDTGLAYPTAPGTVAGEFDEARYAFHNFTAAEVLQQFREFKELMESLNNGVKFLLTVSPVPLTATASPHHVLLATTYSKSVLRTVAGQLSEEFDNVDYFPSYELVASPFSRGMFYEPNLRQVNPGGVELVMKHFFSEHDFDAGQVSDAGKDQHEDDLVCEDLLVDSFANPA